MDEQHWERVNFDYKGKTVCYHYAEVEADAEVLRITIEAQKNVTELGYWRDVATGLLALVDKLCARVVQWVAMWDAVCAERDTALAEVEHLKTLVQPRVPRALRAYAANLSGFLGKAGPLEEAATMEETIQKYRDLADQFALLLVVEKGKET